MAYSSSHPLPERDRRVALFDASHGQPRWSQTGFPSRELHSNFAELTELLCRLGLHCRSTGGEAMAALLPKTHLLVIPPPTGSYDATRERWRRERSALFTPEEVRAVLDFLRHGGRLLAFGFRFGDSFTQTNLSELFSPLGCRLNDDAVIDARVLRETHPLQMQFDATPEYIPYRWAWAGVVRVTWRPSATFAILPEATVWPLALSPGGRCLSFDRRLRSIRFHSLPLAVAGHHGAGRFVLAGGPHVFEIGPLGLLNAADNLRFLKNTLTWLLQDKTNERPAEASRGRELHSVFGGEMTCVDSTGHGARTIASVERILRKTGVLKALNRGGLMP